MDKEYLFGEYAQEMELVSMRNFIQCLQRKEIE
jgi:hypothetical protein